MTEYRTLKAGDVIQAGDQVIEIGLASMGYIPERRYIGFSVGDLAPDIYKFRRPIKEVEND